MKRERVEKKTVKKVISYYVLPYGASQYQVCTTYIWYQGNAINDIKRKFFESIICDDEKLEKLRKRFDRSAAFVEKRLAVEFRQIGAGEIATETTIAHLMHQR